MFFSSLTGLLAGTLHVISGPDHLAAITPFAIENHKKSWYTGLLWGVGHTSGVWIVGALAFLFREFIPIDLISSVSERLVGLMLIGVGIWGIRKALVNKVHFHDHKHEEGIHAHFHVHTGEESHQHPVNHQHTHAPLGIGILHGLAGSSHLVGVLPALLLPDKASAVAYLLSYGIGSIVSMIGFSYLIGAFSRKLVSSARAYSRMLMSFAIAAIAVGVVWLVI